MDFKTTKCKLINLGSKIPRNMCTEFGYERQQCLEKEGIGEGGWVSVP